MGADRKEYICTTPCWHGGSRWRKGEITLFADDELPRSNKGEIRHFERVGPAGEAQKPVGPVGPAVTVNNRRKK